MSETLAEPVKLMIYLTSSPIFLMNPATPSVPSFSRAGSMDLPTAQSIAQKKETGEMPVSDLYQMPFIGKAIFQQVFSDPSLLQSSKMTMPVIRADTATTISHRVMLRSAIKGACARGI